MNLNLIIDIQKKHLQFNLDTIISLGLPQKYPQSWFFLVLWDIIEIFLSPPTKSLLLKGWDKNVDLHRYQTSTWTYPEKH
jgi:hypothetical protein